MLLARPPLTEHPKVFRPFDLNVLCTPPALILSQDQTLYILVLYRLPTNLCPLFAAITLEFFLRQALACLFLSCKVTCLKLIETTRYLLRFRACLHLLLLLVSFSLFNFQGSLSVPLRSCCLVWTALILYHTSYIIVKYFFCFFLILSNMSNLLLFRFILLCKLYKYQCFSFNFLPSCS